MSGDKKVGLEGFKTTERNLSFCGKLESQEGRRSSPASESIFAPMTGKFLLGWLVGLW
jgi:hypothetical protein